VSEVKLIELVGAYSVFPNGGVKIPPRIVTKVTDRYGRVLEQSGTIRKEEVLSPQTAAIMTDMMRSVVENGTARRARTMGFQWPAGGKTGTSDNFCDNWFVGFTPYITGGTWIGFDDKTSLGSAEDGARNAVPTWTDVMIAAHDTLSLTDFPDPGGLIRNYICSESGDLATDRCQRVFNELFLLENQPSNLCPIHESNRRYVPGEDENPFDSSKTERDHF
jgi:penicillin-binding protein 1A